MKNAKTRTLIPHKNFHIYFVTKVMHSGWDVLWNFHDNQMFIFMFSRIVPICDVLQLQCGWSMYRSWDPASCARRCVWSGQSVSYPSWWRWFPNRAAWCESLIVTIVCPPPPNHVLGDVFGVVKAYLTQVGGGGFPTELHDVSYCDNFMSPPPPQPCARRCVWSGKGVPHSSGRWWVPNRAAWCVSYYL